MAIVLILCGFSAITVTFPQCTYMQLFKCVRQSGNSNHEGHYKKLQWLLQDLEKKYKGSMPENKQLHKILHY